MPATNWNESCDRASRILDGVRRERAAPELPWWAARDVLIDQGRESDAAALAAVRDRTFEVLWTDRGQTRNYSLRGVVYDVETSQIVHNTGWMVGADALAGESRLTARFAAHGRVRRVYVTSLGGPSGAWPDWSHLLAAG